MHMTDFIGVSSKKHHVFSSKPAWGQVILGKINSSSAFYIY